MPTWSNPSSRARALISAASTAIFPAEHAHDDQGIVPPPVPEAFAQDALYDESFRVVQLLGAMVESLDVKPEPPRLERSKRRVLKEPHGLPAIARSLGFDHDPLELDGLLAILQPAEKNKADALAARLGNQLEAIAILHRLLMLAAGPRVDER